MSIEAMAAVLNMDYGDPTRKLIALGLANHATKQGRDAWPGVKTLAEYAGCSERTVQRHLPVMIEEGQVRRGNQAAVAHIDPRYRPVVYDVAMDASTRDRWADESRGDNLSPLEPTDDVRGDRFEGSGVTNMASRGDTVMSPKPSINRPKNLTTGSLRSQTPTDHRSQEPPGGPERPIEAPEGQQALIEAPVPAPARSGRGFERFWLTYPRKVGKTAALKAWKAALKGGADPEEIIAGVQPAIDEWRRENRDSKFIPHPTTWLNQGRWADVHEIPPPPPPSYWDHIRRTDMPDASTG